MDDDVTVVKRLHYFDQQFLRERDFTDEQAYHVRMRRQHNRVLHTWGIATGLEVRGLGGAKSVTVEPGTAIDGLGREIVLAAERQVELSGRGAGTFDITVAYHEVATDKTEETGALGFTRWTEEPELVAFPATTADRQQRDPTQRIIVGTVELDASSGFVRVDGAQRRAAGVSGGSFAALEISLRRDDIVAADWVRLSLERADTARLEGALHISGTLVADGLGTFAGGLGVGGAKAPAKGLSVTGPASLGAGLTVAGAITPSLGPSAANGICFPTDPGTGSGDSAYIRYYLAEAPEDTALLIGTGDNAADRLSLRQLGDDRLTIRGGKVGIGISDREATTTLQVGGDATFDKGLSVGGRLTPSLGGGSGQGIQFPGDPGGGARDTAFIRYFAEGADPKGAPARPPGAPVPVAETTKLRIGIDNDPDDRLSLWQMGRDRLTIYNGKVGIGTNDPARGLLHVHGDQIHVSGENGGYSFSGRNVADERGGNPLKPGERWMWFADDGIAQLWAIDERGSNQGTTRLAIWPNGDVRIMGDMEIKGKLLSKAKAGYVYDQFVNNRGDALEQGDVVVFHDNGTQGYYGSGGEIPIPEVDLTDSAYDTRVCGIVDAVHGELQDGAGAADGPAEGMTSRAFTSDEREGLDEATVQPGQVGGFVTLGAYAWCKVDADIAPIATGDLLTTSPTRGHAQRVLDPARAMGATIGKAMGSLTEGRGKIPVFVTLH